MYMFASALVCICVHVSMCSGVSAYVCVCVSVHKHLYVCGVSNIKLVSLAYMTQKVKNVKFLKLCKFKNIIHRHTISFL